MQFCKINDHRLLVYVYQSTGSVLRNTKKEGEV